MPVLRSESVLEIVRGARAFLRVEGGVTRGPTPEDRQRGLTRSLQTARQRVRKQRRALKAKDGEISRLETELRAAGANGGSGGERSRVPKVAGGSGVGALPDYAIIGAQKCGTSSLYSLLGQHPHVRNSTRKEVHYFDLNFGEGPEWYRSHFRPPVRKGRRWPITGESSPYYLAHTLTPERAAREIPEARLIVLLRNPVDRAFSHYQASVRQGWEDLGFEEALEAEGERLRNHEEGMLAKEGYAVAIPQQHSYLARGVYVDQLRRWHRFFDREQLLVLKSEDFFEDMPGAYQTVLDFLGLPEWSPNAVEVRNKGGHTQQIDPETRERLHGHFEPHNQRLYDYLGDDFGW